MVKKVTGTTDATAAAAEAERTGAVGRLLEFVTSNIWAMEPGVLERMVQIVERHCRAERLTAAEIEAATEQRRAKQADEREYQITGDGRAVIPVSGVIAKYSRLVNGTSQARGTSIEQMSEQLDQALADPMVRSILLHIESPGGYLNGLADFADDVRRAGYDKPVVAFIDDLGASAAYWIASQANAVYANQAAEVGSIGVYSIVMDSSAWVAEQGIRMHIIRSGEHKGVGEMGIAISEENLTALQEVVDRHFEMFLSAVSAGRAGSGPDADSLRAIADGRVFVGRDALAMNLIDGVGNFSDVLAAALPPVRDDTGYSGRGSARAGQRIDKENDMETKEKKTAATEATVTAEQATTAERARIQAISSALGEESFAGIRNKAIAEGLTITEAKSLAFDAACERLKGETARLEAEIALRDEKLKAIAAGGVETTAAEPPDSDEETAATDGDPGTAAAYTAKVAELINAGAKKGTAMQRAAGEMPRSHKAWLAEQQKK